MDSPIELYSKINQPLEFIEKLGGWLAKSGMTGGDRPEQGMVLAAACLFEHKSPIQVLREYHIIEGRLSDRADAMLAKFRAKGGKHAVITRTAEEATVELQFDGQKITSKVTFKELQSEPFVFRQDGKTLKKNYATPRARMQTLWARAISDGVRTLTPEIVAGIYTPEEIEDTAIEATAAPLLPAKKKNSQSTEPAIDTTATIVNEPPKVDPATASQEPLQETKAATATATAPFALTDVRADPTSGRLSDETVKALHNVMGAQWESGITWLKQRGWIKESLFELSVDRAKRIIQKPSEFIGHISKGSK